MSFMGLETAYEETRREARIEKTSLPPTGLLARNSFRMRRHLG